MNYILAAIVFLLFLLMQSQLRYVVVTILQRITSADKSEIGLGYEAFRSVSQSKLTN